MALYENRRDSSRGGRCGLGFDLIINQFVFDTSRQSSIYKYIAMINGGLSFECPKDVDKEVKWPRESKRDTAQSLIYTG